MNFIDMMGKYTNYQGYNKHKFLQKIYLKKFLV